MNLDEARDHIGCKVVYRAPHVQSDQAGEEGVITSVNDVFVFVRYGTKTTSAATRPQDLEPVTRLASPTDTWPRRP